MQKKIDNSIQNLVAIDGGAEQRLNVVYFGDFCRRRTKEIKEKTSWDHVEKWGVRKVNGEQCGGVLTGHHRSDFF